MCFAHWKAVLSRWTAAGLEPNGGCSVSDSCVTKYVWKKINDSINQTVDEIKLDQLVKENGKTVETDYSLFNEEMEEKRWIN